MPRRKRLGTVSGGYAALLTDFCGVDRGKDTSFCDFWGIYIISYTII
jgi:hypothetical protein